MKKLVLSFLITVPFIILSQNESKKYCGTTQVMQEVLKDSEKKHCKSKIKKYWNSGNILHYSNAANHYFADIFKDELPKDFVKTPLDRKINKCDILEYIEKEIIGV